MPYPSILKNTLKKRAPLFLLSLLLLLLLLLGGCRPEERNLLRVSLLKVGKADAIIVQTGPETLVIDAGEEDDGEELVEFLERQGISRVDVLVITHFDKDHVGGADTLVEELEVGAVLLPDYEASSTEYLDFMKALESRDITPQRLTQPERFMLGDAVVLVEPPQACAADSDTAETDNNLSLITTIVYGENRLLFTGDAEKARLREWLSGETAVPCGFLKVPHHGVYNKALEDLLAAVTPEYAAICCSSKNPAEQKTLEALEEYQVRTFQTRDGDITILCDGERLEVSQKTR